MMKSLTPRFLLTIILLLYLVLGVLFAVYTPPWQAPDEPAHYNYVRYVAEKGQFPVLHMGDYPHAYLEQIKAARFPADMSIEPIRYEFHQPPLYYALLAPIYGLTGGRLVALRLVSVFLGAGIVAFAYAIGRRVWAPGSTLALAAAAFVAFLPQHLATVSQVGNDVLAELLLAAVLYVLCWRMQEGRSQSAEGRLQTESSIFHLPSSIFHRPSSIVLGFLLGLILITKTTAYIALPLAAGVLIWQWWRERASLRAIVTQGAAVFLPAIVIALPWYVRNISIYGWPDLLGLQRHDAIVVGQLRTAEFIAQSGWPAYWQRAVEWTFKSFWGVFGWMGVWLDSRVYFALALLSGLAVVGLGLRIRDWRLRIADWGLRTACVPRSGIGGWIVLAVSALFTLLAYVWYNTQFLQHQGRYLFTALIPIALAFAAGWDAVVRPGVGRWLAGGLVVLAIGLAIWGVLAGTGLPKWPVAMTLTAAVGLFLLDLALTLLTRYQSGHPVAGQGLGADSRSPLPHAGWSSSEQMPVLRPVPRRMKTFVVTASAVLASLERLKSLLRRGTFLEQAFSFLRAAALAFPYVFSAVVALYALFTAVVPQLS